MTLHVAWHDETKDGEEERTTWEGGKSNADGMERMVSDWLFGSGEDEDEEGKNILIFIVDFSRRRLKLHTELARITPIERR